jgi:hypothetical protein
MWKLWKQSWAGGTPIGDRAELEDDVNIGENCKRGEFLED